jgi:hypothetical protein
MAEAPEGGNVLTRKIGPLPTWVWTAIVGGVIVLWALYQRSKSGSSSSGVDTAAAQASTTPPDVFMVSPNPTTPAGTGTDTTTTTGTQTTPPEQPAPTPTPTPTPGSSSTGPAPVPLKKVGTGKVRIGSSQDLYYLAKQLGVSYNALLKANPALKKYEGTGKGIPSGTTINVPKGAKV